MKALNRGRLVILLILAAVALVTSAAVLGGIEWALASLGALVFIGIGGIGIHTLFKVIQYSRLSFNVRWLENGYPPNQIANVGPVSKKDKRIIMRHVDELFSAGFEQGEERLIRTRPVDKKDKKIIMRNIDGLFAIGQGQIGQKFSRVAPISQKDKRIIMKHVDELFVESPGQSEQEAFLE